MGIFEIVFIVLACAVVVEFAVLITILRPVKPPKFVEPAKVWIRLQQGGNTYPVSENALQDLIEAGIEFKVEPRKGN